MSLSLIPRGMIQVARGSDGCRAGVYSPPPPAGLPEAPRASCIVRVINMEARRARHNTAAPMGLTPFSPRPSTPTSAAAASSSTASCTCWVQRRVPRPVRQVRVEYVSLPGPPRRVRRRSRSYAGLSCAQHLVDEFRWRLWAGTRTAENRRGPARQLSGKDSDSPL